MDEKYCNLCDTYERGEEERVKRLPGVKSYTQSIIERKSSQKRRMDPGSYGLMEK